MSGWARGQVLWDQVFNEVTSSNNPPTENHLVKFMYHPSELLFG